MDPLVWFLIPHYYSLQLDRSWFWQINIYPWPLTCLTLICLDLSKLKPVVTVSLQLPLHSSLNIVQRSKVNWLNILFILSKITLWSGVCGDTDPLVWFLIPHYCSWLCSYDIWKRLCTRTDITIYICSYGLHVKICSKAEYTRFMNL